MWLLIAAFLAGGALLIGMMTGDVSCLRDPIGAVLDAVAAFLNAQVDGTVGGRWA